ncbi:beta-glucosidase [Spirochaetia bacterium]|nr:beta-glucosidase [Spirochaetia bacterium]
MKQFDSNFLLGAATAAHQVEGNNIHSDYWAMEQLPNSDFSEPSLDSVDHYNRYEEDIRLMADAGLNAYRFSIEWARIEPQEDKFDENEVLHYRKVLECCHKYGITPIVTLHHFSSPKWLVEKGGWEWEGLETVFPRYCAYVVKSLGDLMCYVCTINEANMGLQIASVAKSMLFTMGITPQVGMNFEEMIASAMPKDRLKKKQDIAAAFHIDKPDGVHDFLSFRTMRGDELMVRAHCAARAAMKELCPHLKVGLTLSLFDLQTEPGGEKQASAEWEEHFGHYASALAEDDFIGVQNYSRKRVNAQGVMGTPDGAELTQMGYEFYPQAISNVIRRVARQLPGKEMIVTENGIATADDKRRVEFIRQALDGIEACVSEGIPVRGYMYWSLLDNFEWQAGFIKTFGLIAVDRTTQKRIPKESLAFLGSFAQGK